MKIEYYCSNCEYMLESDAEFAGKTVTCGNCENTEIVPCLSANIIPPEDKTYAWPKCPVHKYIAFYLAAVVYNLLNYKTILRPGFWSGNIHQRYKLKLKSYLYETIYRNRLKKFSRNSLAFVDNQQ